MTRCLSKIQPNARPLIIQKSPSHGGSSLGRFLQLLSTTCPRERSSRHWPWKVKLFWVSHPPSLAWGHSAATTRVVGPGRTSQVLPHGADGGRKDGGCVPAGRWVTTLGIWMAVCAAFPLGNRIVCVPEDLPFVYSELPCAVCPFIIRSLKNMHVGWIMHLWKEIWVAFCA